MLQSSPKLTYTYLWSFILGVNGGGRAVPRRSQPRVGWRAVQARAGPVRPVERGGLRTRSEYKLYVQYVVYCNTLSHHLNPHHQ